jgi:hypothetical protein
MTFGLKSLLVAMGVLSAVLFLLTAAPPAVATPLLAGCWVLAGTAALAGVVYGRGAVRAFWLGALVPAGGSVVALVFLLFIWFWVGPYETKNWREFVAKVDELAFTLRLWSGGGGILTLLTGAMSAAVRWAYVGRD